MTEQKYIYKNDNPDHDLNGLVCTIGWEFETCPGFVQCYFDKELVSDRPPHGATYRGLLEPVADDYDDVDDYL